MPGKIYTKTGDDGTTGLLFGGRAPKDSLQIEANGAVDEAQSFLGLVRADLPSKSELQRLLVAVETDLWVLMAEVATAPENRHKLKGGQTKVTEEMVRSLEQQIDDFTSRSTIPLQFVVPGENPVSARLDVARTVVRRAERLVVTLHLGEESQAGPYLNRLSDLVWTLARWCEGDHRTLAGKERRPRKQLGTSNKAGPGKKASPAKKASADTKASAVKKSRAAKNEIPTKKKAKGEGS
ncbi:MAG TPA: cob(I)yrinic acid a,c-diamide adenosyltransferase [Acidimicrobiales bacterium]|nr:cob(I)yrinic acid a,c-diamide adenosyltransferase [Acidimicrobiales bacterium]